MAPSVSAKLSAGVTLNSFETSVVEGMLVHAHYSDGILGVEHLLGLETRSAMLLPHGG